MAEERESFSEYIEEEQYKKLDKQMLSQIVDFVEKKGRENLFQACLQTMASKTEREAYLWILKAVRELYHGYHMIGLAFPEVDLLLRAMYELDTRGRSAPELTPGMNTEQIEKLLKISDERELAFANLYKEEAAKLSGVYALILQTFYHLLYKFNIYQHLTQRNNQPFDRFIATLEPLEKFVEKLKIQETTKK